ncbi:Mycobacteriophage D29, Gp61 [uncultured Caudovirales phage]|uniref:Mycobacteriophage D29, Gp61 n=1 Tax=uncultured Caudovirales phage TaxID=2100421 RepID=A0A6J5TCC3_9CAUD|nr:Mycobacteriophage D29, Gp61 [uncultured Caudovirales phage]
MKVIIAGGRDFNDYLLLLQAVVKADFGITSVVSGCAKGADTLGELFARDLDIPLHKFPADWDKHGRAAGPMRNGEMAKFADALIAFWDGKSTGTANMIKQATERGLKVHVERYEQTN